MLIVFSAGATMPMTDNGSMEQQSVTIATEDGDDDGYWWGASFDIASNYLWRGYDQSYRGGNRTMFDPALQGGVTFGYGKFYIDLWANHSLISKYNEFDIFLGFEHENLAITAYDVLWGVCGDMGSMNPFNAKNHSLTTTIDYTLFDCLRLHWATTFIHSGDKLANGKQAFSSYFEVGYTQPFGDVLSMEIIAGAAPWTGPFWMAGPRKMVDGAYTLDFDNQPQGFNVTNLSISLPRDFEVGSVTLPLNVGYTYNPTTNRHYALLKAGFAF
jgi:hypothetical protein